MSHAWMACAKGAPEWEPLRPANGTEIFYKDWGEGQAIVFSHGWPLSAADRDNQLRFSVEGLPCRCAHPAAVMGRSTQTGGGHDMDQVLQTYKDLPHGIPTTHPDVVNADLLEFIQS
ncbi:alpha/beta fold hydrolase [Kribbella qitaiheensis]|uniref:alpha/beta fold hydrolase n=1 Tax=Kribbella qitaiheensis TaxID=1544730 RepID=UPI003618BB0B